MHEQIKIQQALFGYRDGHNLLATSTALAPRVRQFLATVTDSSGPENAMGFDGTFTGLPVPETDFYALFCTWFAPEMPRPGCVWSHVILVQLADLARIPELFRLRNLCVRPSHPIEVAYYKQSLTLNVSSMKEDEKWTPDERRLESLVRALYEYPEKCVVILDEESAQWEYSIFSVWSQQWPRLRREFAFSTGSLGDRRLTGLTFDLQIAPLSSERLWRRTEAPTHLLNFLAPTPILFGESISQWGNVTKQDLRKESSRQFRQFLFDFGSDIDKPRTAFQKLATIYNQIVMASESSWKELLCLVGESFPNQTDAVRLKRWMVTIPASLNRSDKLERTWTIVCFLLDSFQSDAYPNLDFDFTQSATSFWKEKQQESIALLCRLLQLGEKPAAISFADGIANSIDPVSLRIIADSHEELVPLVIKHNPALAFEIDTWKLSGHIQTQVYDALTTCSLNQAEWGRIVGSMFIASTYVSVRDAVEKAGPFAMSGAFRWLEHQGADEVLPSQAWRDALSIPAIAILTQTENLQPAQLALSVWCVPSDKVLRTLSTSREDVQQLADEFPDAIPVPLRIPTAFLLLTIGLKENSDNAANLILKNFFVVHNALASGTYPPESWWLLSSELPSLGWLSDWDRCKKLRRSVNTYLSRHGESQRLWEFAKTPLEQKIARKVTGIDRDDWLSDFVD